MIETREYFVYDSVTGEIFEKIQAYSKKLLHKPDRSEWWVLEHIDGEFGNNKWYNEDTAICVGVCYLNPTETGKFKLKSGTEKEFEFFEKNGYNKENQVDV
tara:strand:- start:337 stop:639 length:303 start_codon:yes stop_codon:yes gene_type:complete